MENDQDQQQNSPEKTSPVASSTPPSPMGRKQGGSNKKGALIFILIIALLGIGIFFIVRGSNTPIETASPTPASDLSGFQTPEATGSPEPIDREDYSIEVQNGTGIAKEASLLQGKLANLGYTDIEMANAQDQDNEVTIVTFSEDVPDAIVDEIMEVLEDTYEDVEKEIDESAATDIVIVTGLRNNQTPKPASTEDTEDDSSPETPTPSPTGTRSE